MRQCPHCSKRIKDDVEVCKYCLRPVSSPAFEDEVTKAVENALSQARSAHQAGARIFQIALPLSQTVATFSARADSGTSTAEHGTVLDAVESEGWRLEHANYVYRITGSVILDKFLPSGQQEAVSGEIIGVYLFRRLVA
jgi:hypothetical protein